MYKNQEKSRPNLTPFFNNMQGLMDRAYTALARQDLRELQQITASLRATASSGGEVLLQVQAQLLEQAVNLQQWQRAASLLEKIRHSLDRTVAASAPTKAKEPEVKPTPAEPAAPEIRRLGSYLVEAELLTDDQVDVVLADQKVTGLRFGEIAAKRGWVKQGTIEFLMKRVVLPERRELHKQMTQRSHSDQQSVAEQPANVIPEIVNYRDTILLDPEEA